MAIHALHDAVSALVVFGVGLLLGLTWLRTCSWLACVLLHGVYNGAMLAALLLGMPA